MALYGAVGDAALTRGGKRRGVMVWVQTGALSAGTATFTTPFKKVLNCALSLNEATIDGAGLGTSTLTWTAVGNIVTVNGFQPTSNANPTLVAATNATPIGITVYGLYNG